MKKMTFNNLQSHPESFLLNFSFHFLNVLDNLLYILKLDPFSSLQDFIQLKGLFVSLFFSLNSNALVDRELLMRKPHSDFFLFSFFSFIFPCWLLLLAHSGLTSKESKACLSIFAYNFNENFQWVFQHFIL